eukprot:gene6676-1447_t
MVRDALLDDLLASVATLIGPRGATSTKVVDDPAHT